MSNDPRAELDAAGLLLGVRAAAVSLGSATLALRLGSVAQAEQHIRQALGRIVALDAALVPVAEREARSAKL